MWTKIKDTQFFLIFSQDSEYEISVTDYLNVWTALFSKKAFLDQLKESNDGLELPHDNDFIQKGVNLLSNLDKLKKCSIEKKENGKSLFITMTISFGFPFYLECTLSKGSEEVYFQKVTRPLLKIICDLRESQTELRRLLIKKDSEIEEYKCEGGEIVLRHLKTIAFNDAEHMKIHKVFEESFGTASTSTKVLEEAVKVLEKSIPKQEPLATPSSEPGPSIRTEPVSVIKTEPSLNVKMEPDTTVKTEPIGTLKMEPNSEGAEESSSSVITASVSCKQEIKREQARAHVPRKRSKFNF
ncbi:hypothetical protein PYW07_001612 [Mythimna separata]|uniref:Non-homologous end-joining factor 1 n=1 Tax=Mythimna separata TaxID=271217 RepID=A0AAD7YU82_MYTSE|nr:hypothetical protein PYW07_001612 [Mythimna separata]